MMIKRILGFAFIALLVLFLGVASLIIFPQPLFAHEVEYRNFRIYSMEPVNVDFSAILDNAIDLVSRSELHDSTYVYDIFLAHSSVYNTIDDFVLGHGPAARATDNNVVIKVEVDIMTNRFFRTFYQKCEGDLSYLIAHEMVHCLQAHHFGKLTFNPFLLPELWKLEGYPEYIARHPQLLAEDYDLVAEIETYLELKSHAVDFWMASEKAGCKVPEYYFKGRLMTEFLIDVKKRSYHSIINDETSEEEIFAEMIRWKEI